MSTKTKILIILLLTSTFSVWSAYAYSEEPSVSDLWSCHYQIVWDERSGADFNTGWISVWLTDTPSGKKCAQTVDFGLLPSNAEWVTKVPDGIFELFFKAQDKSSPVNTFGPENKWLYKIDTAWPVCVLNKIELWWLENQYYNNDRLYYKNASDASWKMKFNISCKDVVDSYAANTCGPTNEPCVSWLSDLTLPSLLWASAQVSYPTWVNNANYKDFIITYDWSGSHTETMDLLNNASTWFAFFDEAINKTGLLNSNTELEFLDENGIELTPVSKILNIQKLILTPDSTSPLVNDITYDFANLASTTQSFEFKDWNDSDWNFVNIYDADTALTKPFAAYEFKNIKTPKFTDNGSWLRTYNINIENDTTTSVYGYASYLWSDLNNGKITNLLSNEFTHSFKDVSSLGAFDYESEGYRNYEWKITSYLQDGETETDKICDMVNNCIDIPTPDFKVVANVPDVDKTISNVSVLYENKISNYSNTHEFEIKYRDKYDNYVVPVENVKDIVLTNTFTNTLWLNQLSITDALDWSWVEFIFTDWNNDNIISSNWTEFHNFPTTRSVESDLDDGIVKLSIRSAVPTKAEYRTTSGHWRWEFTMYWDTLSAQLKFSEFNIDVNSDTVKSYVWVWEYSTPTWDLSFLRNAWNDLLPDYRFNPVISFNSIENIYPLVEWQVKDMDIEKIQEEALTYSLDIYSWTNNSFLEITQSRLENNNERNWSWFNDLTDPTGDKDHNKYSVYNWFVTGTNWYWYMDYNDIPSKLLKNTFQILPQTIGWVNINNVKIGLFSELEYTTNTTPAKTVYLPWIQTWLDKFWIHTIWEFAADWSYEWNSSIVFAEVKITWITQTNNVTWNTDWDGAVTSDDSTYNDFSQITLLDLQTSVNKNIAKLLKWADLNKWSDWTVDIIDFNDIKLANSNEFYSDQWLVLQWGDVLYVKDRDVSIDCWTACEISWKKTIIVENGNLFIKSDMFYDKDNLNSVLWIALIWNTSNWNTSQLRINEDITNGVWIIYAEWPIVSVNVNDNLADEYYDWNNVEEQLYNQLHWKWSFMSKNTVWWSIKNLDSRTSCPYGTPEYEDDINCTRERAQAYDLIYLRRYARVNQDYYGISSNPMWDSGTHSPTNPHMIPLHSDIVDIKIAWGWLISDNGDTLTIPSDSDLIFAPDEYNSPLIIDYDSNIQSNPPYVFE